MPARGSSSRSRARGRSSSSRRWPRPGASRAGDPGASRRERQPLLRRRVASAATERCPARLRGWTARRRSSTTSPDAAQGQQGEARRSDQGDDGRARRRRAAGRPGIKTIQLVGRRRRRSASGLPPRTTKPCSRPAARRWRRPTRCRPIRRRSCACARARRGLTPASWTPTSASSRPGIGTGRSGGHTSARAVTGTRPRASPISRSTTMAGGNLTGRLAGSTPQRSMSNPSARSRHGSRPAHSAQSWSGLTRPGRIRFQSKPSTCRTTPGRASSLAPPASASKSAFFTVYEGPMFGDAFRDLRRQPDGSWKSKMAKTRFRRVEVPAPPPIR